MMNLYSIRDLKSEFQPPFPAKSDEEAIRAFKFSLDTNKLMDLNRSDFELYNVGLFHPMMINDAGDDYVITGSVPVRIAEGRNFVKVGD